MLGIEYKNHTKEELEDIQLYLEDKLINKTNTEKHTKVCKKMCKNINARHQLVSMITDVWCLTRPSNLILMLTPMFVATLWGYTSGSYKPTMLDVSITLSSMFVVMVFVSNILNSTYRQIEGKIRFYYEDPNKTVVDYTIKKEVQTSKFVIRFMLLVGYYGVLSTVFREQLTINMQLNYKLVLIAIIIEHSIYNYINNNAKLDYAQVFKLEEKGD